MEYSIRDPGRGSRPEQGRPGERVIMHHFAEGTVEVTVLFTHICPLGGGSGARPPWGRLHRPLFSPRPMLLPGGGPGQMAGRICRQVTLWSAVRPLPSLPQCFSSSGYWLLCHPSIWRKAWPPGSAPGSCRCGVAEPCSLERGTRKHCRPLPHETSPQLGVPPSAPLGRAALGAMLLDWGPPALGSRGWLLPEAVNPQ